MTTVCGKPDCIYPNCDLCNCRPAPQKRRADLVPVREAADLEAIVTEARAYNAKKGKFSSLGGLIEHLAASGHLRPKADQERLAEREHLAAAILDLADSLRLAQGIFAHYADLHSTKCTPDGDAKSQANLQHSNSAAIIIKKHAAIIDKLRKEKP